MGLSFPRMLSTGPSLMQRREGNPPLRCLWVLRTQSLWEGKPFPVYLVRLTVFYKLAFLKLDHTSESPGGIVTTQTFGPYPEFLIQQVLEEAQELAFPTNSQVILMLLVWKPHLRTTGQGKKCYKWTSPYLSHRCLLDGTPKCLHSLIFVGFPLFVCIFL